MADDAGRGTDALGAQALRAWTGALDAWWEMLLRDSGRVSELASRIAGVGGSGAGAGGAVSARDLAAVLEALEIVQRRLDDLDRQVGVLARGLSEVVDHLGRLDARTDTDES